MAQLVKLSQRSSLFVGFLRTNVRKFSTPVESPKSSENSGQNLLSNKIHKVNDFEKKLLVWSGKYKKGEEIPKYLSPDVVEK